MDGWIDNVLSWLLLIHQLRHVLLLCYMVLYVIYTHLKKTVTVDLLRKCLGGPDMKKRSVGNPLDELILFSLETA